MSIAETEDDKRTSKAIRHIEYAHRGYRPVDTKQTIMDGPTW